MKLEDFKSGDRVMYIPGHAHGDPSHPDCETGRVSSIGTKYVFVRFNRQVEKLGWDGATSQSCDPRDLVKVGGHTLIELMVCLGIVAILTTVGLFIYLKFAHNVFQWLRAHNFAF